jgi:hypothetical protein
VQPLHEVPPEFFRVLIGLICAAALAALAAALVFLRRARNIEDLQISRIRSAAQGYVAIEGHTLMMPGPEIVSPLSGRRCVWWHYSIHERQTSGRETEWVEIEAGTSDDLFLIADPTGHCVVDPEHADILPSMARRWSGDFPRPAMGPAALNLTPWLNLGARYRYHERLVQVGDLLYASGWFRTLSAQQEFDEKRDLTELLAEWKRDRRELLRRFDANHDGTIDAEEWEQVRRAALEDVRRQQLERALDPDLSVLSAPPDGRRYLLSVVARPALARRYRLFAAGCLVLCGAAVIFTAQLLHRYGSF